MEALATAKVINKKEVTLPDELIYEVIGGRIFYRKGYRDFLNKTKTIEELMGASGLQSLICTYLLMRVFAKLNEDKYFILANEIGLHIDHRNNLASDVAIFETEILTPEHIDIHYVDVPAKIYVEVDIRADVEDLGDTGYIDLKTKELLQFGGEKVIWILSNIQKVIVVDKGATRWVWHDWNEDVEVLDGVSFNVGKYLKRKGINVRLKL